MDIRKLQRAIVDGLEDVKAHNILVFNTEHLSPLFERVIIASGTSNRQTKALAASVRDVVKSRGLPVLRTEGEDNGEWIIVDCGAAVAHIMQPGIRDYYHLEEIWGEKPVRLKMGDGAVPRRETANAQQAAQHPPAAKKAAAKKASATKAPAKKAPAKKAATRKAVAEKAVPPVKAAAPKSAAKPPATPARKAAAKKAPAARKTTRTVGGLKAAAKTSARRSPARPPSSRG